MNPILITALIVYATGSVASIPGSLRRRMTAPVCRQCWEYGNSDNHHDHRARATEVPRGSLEERNTWDAIVAIVRALFWPLRLAGHAIVRTLRGILAGIDALVLRTVPLTAPELQRRDEEQAKRLAEQQADIKRQTAQLGISTATDPEIPDDHTS
jgi:hypothetical protein